MSGTEAPDRFVTSLGLRAGDWVEVKSREEVLATLDERGCLDELPFMPEMLAFCGRRFRVVKRADKTCNTIDKTGASRRMTNAVHLEGLRCDGEAHGGCQASCLLFWKEGWLKPAPDESGPAPKAPSRAPTRPSRGVCDEEALSRAVHQPGDAAPVRHACQATELKKATTPLSEWDVRQYWRDLASGNVGLGQFVRTFFYWLFTKTTGLGAYRVQRSLYNRFQAMRGGVPYTRDLVGELERATPTERTGLQPGEGVRVKSQEAILETLDGQNRNRGLYFDAPEMVPYCGKRFKVLKRVERIINEATGEMMEFGNPCIILDSVVCQGTYSAGRYFCPRAIYPYWREIWLERENAKEAD